MTLFFIDQFGKKIEVWKITVVVLEFGRLGYNTLMEQGINKLVLWKPICWYLLKFKCSYALIQQLYFQCLGKGSQLSVPQEGLYVNSLWNNDGRKVKTA